MIDGLESESAGRVCVMMTAMNVANLPLPWCVRSKAIYAYDKANNLGPQPTTQYFLRAVKTGKENKAHYAAVEAQALLQPKSPMAGFMRSFVTSRVFKQDEDDD